VIGEEASLLALSKKAHSALHTLVRSLGYDAAFGRRLYYEVSRNDISDIQAEGSVSMRIGGTPSASFFKVTSEQLQDRQGRIRGRLDELQRFWDRER
jgi:hypothetical protein